MNIGSLMEASTILHAGVTSPVAALRQEINQMKSELRWYQEKNPQTDTVKRSERLCRLELIVREIEWCEPINVTRIIREKLTEAIKDRFNPDVACIWMPLRASMPDILHARPAIIDLTGWTISSEYDYDHVGALNGAYIASDTDENGNRYGR